jgi:hypothetical protein
MQAASTARCFRAPVVRVDPMNLENRSGDDATNRRDSLHSQPFRIVVTSTATTSWALACRWKSRPQIKTGCRGGNQSECAVCFDNGSGGDRLSKA